MIAEVIVDLAEHDLALGAAVIGAELFEHAERARDEPTPVAGRGEVRRDVAEQAEAVRLGPVIAGLFEDPARLFGLAPRVLEPPGVTQRLGPPAQVRGQPLAFELAVEESEIAQRGGEIPGLPPQERGLSVEQRGGVGDVAGAEQVDDAVTDDAAARRGGVARQRLGGGAEDHRCVGLEEELAEQVLLQERVRPAQTIPRDEEDLRALHRQDRRVRIDADEVELGLEHVVADVAAERRGCEGAAP